MTSRVLPLCATALALAGCAATPDASPSGGIGAANTVRTYTYYDANHPDGIVAQPSEQAIYNINHGTWLWPPASSNDPPP